MQDQYWSCINVSEAVLAAGQGRRAPAFMPDQLWSGINAGGPGVHIPSGVRMELEWLYNKYFLSPNIESYIYEYLIFGESVLPKYTGVWRKKSSPYGVGISSASLG